MTPEAESKFDAPMLETEVFRKQMCCSEESTCDIARTFRHPPQSFGTPIVIRRPGNCAPFSPSLPPCPAMNDIVLFRSPATWTRKARHRTKIYEQWQGPKERARVNLVKRDRGWRHIYTKQAILRFRI